jgi:hypothetical protein
MTLSVSFTNATGDTDTVIVSLVFAALDEAGDVIEMKTVTSIEEAMVGNRMDATPSWDISFSNVSKPIKRVVGMWFGYAYTTGNTGEQYASGITLADNRPGDSGFALNLPLTNPASIDVEAIEATSDIPVRPIHVHIIEGLNANASVMLKATALLASVPDSSNAKSMRGRHALDRVVNNSQVEIYLKQLTQSMPRAMRSSEAKFLSDVMSEWKRRVEFDDALVAMDMGFLSTMFEETKKAVQQGSRDVNAFLDKAIPVAKEASKVAQGLAVAGLLPPEAAVGAEAFAQGLEKYTDVGRKTGLLIR